jgi:hypothetical protein
VAFGQSDDYKAKLAEKEKKEHPTKVNDTSKLNIDSQLAGYTMISIEASPCNNKYDFQTYDLLVRKEYRNDTLELEITLFSNCCSSFLGEIKIKNDTTLNIIYSDYNQICSCICCFHLT